MPTATRIRLDQITVASPCIVDWGSMTGSEQIRHCGLCEKHVYNLTMMSETQIENLFAQHEQAPCIRFYRRRDCTIITQDNCASFTPIQQNFPLKGFIPLAVGVLLAGCQHQQPVYAQSIFSQPSSIQKLGITLTPLVGWQDFNGNSPKRGQGNSPYGDVVSAFGWTAGELTPSDIKHSSAS